VSDDTVPTPDLRPFGFFPVGHPPLMVRPPRREAPAPRDDLRVVAAATPELLFDFERTFVEAYPVPECTPARPGVMVASDLGRSVYERLGYRSLLRFTLWVFPNQRA